MLSGAQLCQKFDHGQQPTERHGYRQRHTAQTFAGDWFSIHLINPILLTLDCGFPVAVSMGGQQVCSKKSFH